jgi:putative protein kinase ArgK-like GTPase of G3E family
MTTFTSAPALDIDHILGDETLHIIVCTGAGGVGKTTTAAALGLRAAEMGRDVCVLTIDPAKRLAQAMGLSSLGLALRDDARHETDLRRGRGVTR